MRKPVKTDMVQRHLEEHPEGLTSMQAVQLYGITRLAVHISDLRHKRALQIESIPETGTDRYGNASSYVRYVLRGSDG